MNKIAFIFPGQGAQYVGMGKDFYDNFSVSKDTFEQANESLDIDIKKLCFEGSEEALKKTENTQPAILTTSIAMLRALKEEGINCNYTAGLSLGEYSALVEAGAFKFEDAVPLVKKRGKFMQEAVPEGQGGMAAILGLEKEKVLKGIQNSKQCGVVEIANYNTPGQIVISGETEALKISVDECKKMGARKAVVLPVSAPFHCSLLKPAGEKLKEELLKIDINDLKEQVVTNVDAKPLKDKKQVVPSLIRQVSNSVLWYNSVEYMLNEGVDTFVEIGPGRTLSSFVKRISRHLNKKVNTLTINDISTFEKACDFFNKED